jgi:hypothetical protein
VINTHAHTKEVKSVASVRWKKLKQAEARRLLRQKKEKEVKISFFS